MYFYMFLSTFTILLYADCAVIKEDSVKLVDKDSKSSNTSCSDTHQKIYRQVESVVNSNNRCAELYNSIVDMFLEKFCVNFSINNNGVDVMIVIPDDYDNDYIRKMCNKKTENAMIDTEDMQLLNFYLNLFIDNAIFAVNTINRIFNLKTPENSKKAKNVLETNQKLLTDYIITMNWLYSLTDLNTLNNHSFLLFNFNYFETPRFTEINSKAYIFQHKYLANLANITKIVILLKKQEIVSNVDYASEQNIYENESILEIIKWCNGEAKDCKEIKENIKRAYDAITANNNIKTNVKFLVKGKYYYNNAENSVMLVFKNTNFATELQLSYILMNLYNMQFDTLHMYTDKSIVSSFDVVVLLEKDVHQLLKFTEHINNYLFEEFKQKMNAVTQKYFDNLISNRKKNKFYEFLRRKRKNYKDAKKSCTQKISKLQNYYVYKTGMNVKEVQAIFENLNIDEIYSDAYKSYEKHVKLHEKQKGDITNELQIVWSEILTSEVYILYTQLLKNMKLIVEVQSILNDRKNDNVFRSMVENECKIYPNINHAKNNGLDVNTQSKTKINTNEILSDKSVIIDFLDEIIQLKNKVAEAQQSVFVIIKQNCEKLQERR